MLTSYCAEALVTTFQYSNVGLYPTGSCQSGHGQTHPLAEFTYNNDQLLMHLWQSKRVDQGTIIRVLPSRSACITCASC